MEKSGYAPVPKCSYRQSIRSVMAITSNSDSAAYFRATRQFKEGRFSACIEELLRLSASGDARATLWTANIFHNGGDGIERDWERARKLYRLSLTQSFLSGGAIGLALMAYNGQGGERDRPEAFSLFSKAPDNSLSQIMLGLMKQQGDGCVQNEDEALSHFDTAWRMGHPGGLKNAALIRLHRGQYPRAVFDFVRSGFMIFWHFGVKKRPMQRSPRDYAQEA